MRGQGDDLADQMRIVTWNLGGRVRRLAEQAQLVVELHADVLCLQELTQSTVPLWTDLLRAAGYHSLAAPDPGPRRPRNLRVLTAARTPIQALPVPGVPWPERVLAVRSEDGSEIVNVHAPTSAKPELAKVRTHEAVFAHLARRSPRRLRILCGDLNTPRKEHADGTIWTFARDRYGRLREDRGEAWDRAELALIQGLRAYGFRDAYRGLHGYAQRELSWEWARWNGGYRLDHLLFSGPWRTTSCHYMHALRRSGLSDHSPLLVDLQRAPRRAGNPSRSPRRRRMAESGAPAPETARARE